MLHAYRCLMFAKCTDSRYSPWSNADCVSLHLLQVVEAEHAPDDTSITPLKPLEAMLSIDLSHPNIIHTYKYYTRIRQVLHPFLQRHQLPNDSSLAVCCVAVLLTNDAQAVQPHGALI